MNPVKPVPMSTAITERVSIKNSFDALADHSAGPMDVPILDLVFESKRKLRNKTKHKKRFINDECNCSGSYSLVDGAAHDGSFLIVQPQRSMATRTSSYTVAMSTTTTLSSSSTEAMSITYYHTEQQGEGEVYIHKYVGWEPFRICR